MNSGNFLGGMVIGAAVGLVTGLLIAPSSGNQTRRNIVRRSRAYSQQAVDAVRHYLDTVRQGRGPVSGSISADELLGQYSNGRPSSL